MSKSETITTISTYPDNPKHEYNRTLQIVRSCLPHSFDSEDICIGILLESWSNNVLRPTRNFIQQRCIDQLRARKIENSMLDELRFRQKDSHPEVNYKADVSTLIKVLSPLEQKLIWYRFYLAVPMREIAKKTGVPLNRVRRILWVALFRMREAAEVER